MIERAVIIEEKQKNTKSLWMINVARNRNFLIHDMYYYFNSGKDQKPQKGL